MSSTARPMSSLVMAVLVLAGIALVLFGATLDGPASGGVRGAGAGLVASTLVLGIGGRLRR